MLGAAGPSGPSFLLPPAQHSWEMDPQASAGVLSCAPAGRPPSEVGSLPPHPVTLSPTWGLLFFPFVGCQKGALQTGPGRHASKRLHHVQVRIGPSLGPGA